MMLQYILQQTEHLQPVLYSGRSFLPNDSACHIEGALKKQQRLYTPNDYINVMQNCRKQKALHVNKLETKDFLSSNELDNAITNRKVAANGEKITGYKSRKFTHKTEPYKIHFKMDFDGEILEVDLKKKGRGRSVFHRYVSLLWPSGKPISAPKLVNIMSIMHLIPYDAVGFYNNLVADKLAEDDVDGFGLWILISNNFCNSFKFQCIRSYQ